MPIKILLGRVSKDHPIVKERIKEQIALLKVTATLFKTPDLDEAFQQCLEVIRNGLQFPAHTAVRIKTFDGREFKTDNYKESNRVLSSKIERDGDIYIHVDVYYTRWFPSYRGSVFLDEEKSLLDGVAELLSMYLDQWFSIKKLRENEAHIKKITSHIPGNIYQFQMNDEGEIMILFANKGMGDFNNHIDVEKLKENSKNISKVIHPDDHDSYFACLKASHFSLEDISVQYRTVAKDITTWRWMWARAEKLDNGEVMWYGCTKDITPIIEYVDVLEQIVFDISHVIRRPVTTMLGLTEIINNTTDFDEKTIRNIADDLRAVAAEIDDFTKKLNNDYSEKKLNVPELKKGHQLVNTRSDYFEKSPQPQ